MLNTKVMNWLVAIALAIGGSTWGTGAMSSVFPSQHVAHTVSAQEDRATQEVAGEIGTPESPTSPMGCDCLCHASMHLTGVVSMATTVFHTREPAGFDRLVSPFLQFFPSGIDRPPNLEAV